MGAKTKVFNTPQQNPVIVSSAMQQTKIVLISDSQTHVPICLAHLSDLRGLADGFQSYSFDVCVPVLSSGCLIVFDLLVPRREPSQSSAVSWALHQWVTIQGWTVQFNTCEVQLFPGCYKLFYALCGAVNVCYAAYTLFCRCSQVYKEHVWFRYVCLLELLSRSYDLEWHFQAHVLKILTLLIVRPQRNIWALNLAPHWRIHNQEVTLDTLSPYIKRGKSRKTFETEYIVCFRQQHPHKPPIPNAVHKEHGSF